VRAAPEVSLPTEDNALDLSLFCFNFRSRPSNQWSPPRASASINHRRRRICSESLGIALTQGRVAQCVHLNNCKIHKVTAFCRQVDDRLRKRKADTATTCCCRLDFRSAAFLLPSSLSAAASCTRPAADQIESAIDGEPVPKPAPDE
jgi:hypothetical protein